MIVTAISAFVFAGVLSAYIFLGRGLTRQGNEEQLESRSRVALRYFTQDVSSASGFVTVPASLIPTTSQFTVTTMLPVLSINPNQPLPPVPGTACYTYDSVSGTLSVTRTTPVLESTLMFPAWPTQDFGQAPVKQLLLTGISPSAPFEGFTYLDMGGNAVNPAATGTAGIKQISMNFTTQAGVAFTGAQSQLVVVSSRVILKNKPSLFQ
jgi:hypothetical protein